MNATIDEAIRRLDALKSNPNGYSDDDILILPRAGNPGAGPAGTIYMNQFDPGIASMNSTRRPQKLLKNDGTVVTETVKSVIVPDQKIVPTALSFGLGTRIFTLRSFLSANAVRATNSLEDIDHCSANNSTNCAVQSISVPVLFAAMGAFVFVRDNEVLFEMAKSADKELIYIEGANHGFTGCVPARPRPGSTRTASGTSSTTRRNGSTHGSSRRLCAAAGCIVLPIRVGLRVSLLTREQEQLRCASRPR